MNGVNLHNLIILRQNNDTSLDKVKYRNTILILFIGLTIKIDYSKIYLRIYF